MSVAWSPTTSFQPCCSLRLGIIPLALIRSIMPVVSAEAIYYMRSTVSIFDPSSQAESQNPGSGARGRNLYI